MSSSVSFKPMVSNFAPSEKSGVAKDLKVQLSELNEKSKNHRLNDLSVMSNRMDLESRINDTKSAPVKFIEDVKPLKPSNSVKEAKLQAYVTPTLDSTVKKFQQGKAPSRVEQDMLLTNQMDQMALSNKVLHGLV